jgi:hypothetical protein
VFPRLTQGTHDFCLFSADLITFRPREICPAISLQALHGLHGLRQITRSDNLDP